MAEMPFKKSTSFCESSLTSRGRMDECSLTARGRMDEEEDPYFEMVFPMSQASLDSNKSDTVSFCSLSKSVESVCTLDSPDSYSRSSRESSQVPSLPNYPKERPKTLKIPGLNFLKRDSNYASLPRSEKQKVPRITRKNFSVSVPTTPADSAQSSWTQDNGFLGKGDFYSSISSVEEAGLDTSTPKRKSHRSRLSLNMSVSSRNGSPEKNKPSRLNIPGMLRASFNRLWSKSKTPEQEKEPLSLPILGSDAIDYISIPRIGSSKCHTPSTPRIKCRTPSQQGGRCHTPSLPGIGSQTPPMPCETPPTPLTQAYINDMMAKGLPIIPFADPTFVLVERKLEEMKTNIRKNSMTPPPQAPPPTRSQSQEKSDFSGSPSSCETYQTYQGKNKLRSVKSAPTSRKVSTVQKLCKFSLQQEPDNLENVLNLAKAELEEEALSTKNRSRGWVRGYACNNSRALTRRRSSDVHYVKGDNFIEHLKSKQLNLLRQRKMRASSESTSESDENLNYLNMDFRLDSGNTTQEESEGPTEKMQRHHGNLVESEEEYLPMDCGSGFRTLELNETKSENRSVFLKNNDP